MKNPLSYTSINVAEIGSFSVGGHVRAVTGQPEPGRVRYEKPSKLHFDKCC